MRYQNPLTSSYCWGFAMLAALVVFFAPPLKAAECMAPSFSTGVSVDERQEPHRDYSLKVVLAQQKNLLAGIKVTIWEGQKLVVEANDAGPWFYVKLPAGSYRIVAALASGKERQAKVEIPKGGGQKVVVVTFP